jgi:hypothetical protein
MLPSAFLEQLPLPPLITVAMSHVQFAGQSVFDVHETVFAWQCDVGRFVHVQSVGTGAGVGTPPDVVGAGAGVGTPPDVVGTGAGAVAVGGGGGRSPPFATPASATPNPPPPEQPHS